MLTMIAIILWFIIKAVINPLRVQLHSFNSVKNKRYGKPLLPDEIRYKNLTYGLNIELPWLKSGDIVFICQEGENINNINWQDFDYY